MRKYRFFALLTLLCVGLTACSYGPEKQKSDLVFTAHEVAGDELSVDYCAIPEPEPEEPIFIAPREPSLAAKLYFITDTTILIDESAEIAEELYQKIIDMQPTEVIVIGHTDTMASVQHNIGLSLRRAEFAKGELVARGIDADIIKATWHGESMLLIDTPDQTDEQKNRRVEIYVR
jgi:outer membrane protein OmpA-like peptidoglycan-associated protein